MQNKIYLACVGTRPEIIKMAPVYHEMRSRGHTMLLVHTGQHESITDGLYAFFDMLPDITIYLKRQSSSLTHLTCALLESIDSAVEQLKPDVILVQGDTTSAFVGALIGCYHHKQVAHIEAGLRTHESEPFPEEKNREMIGRLSDWHFSPTEQAVMNLQNEGICSSRIFEVGNTVIDAAIWTNQRISAENFDFSLAAPPELVLFIAHYSVRRLILVTAHRRENWGQPIRDIAIAVGRLLLRHEDVVVVWPVHPNPAVRVSVEDEIRQLPTSVQERICLTEPLGYQALIAILVRCEFALTDSGGIQEEASAFGKPVLITRKSTERQELVDAGGALLVGTDTDLILDKAELLLSDPLFYRQMQLNESPFGDGHSARHIVDVLTQEISSVALLAGHLPSANVYSEGGISL
ncbi:non-hydrolyzing UDP-N-acetylglucosamine 2-epimerase [Undibacterium sp. SXout7W]|uniref:non-hydrolyzing UDP-N-acetylglucosamine 2-epimerase n=1 Tax=Undibacterium sp. SXout7W TaxID=3413049 RepID=UPI003BF20812